MSIADIIPALHKNDKSVTKYLFETYYGRLMALVIRYSKSHIQAHEIFNGAFNNCLQKLQQQKHLQQNDLEAFLEEEMIKESIAYIKNIRSEYYVASTVYVNGKENKNYDLFENNELIDFYAIDNEILIKSLHLLVPSQRLVFNLHIIDGYSLEESAQLLEASEQTVKSNLEKARVQPAEEYRKEPETVKV
jgi:RNA polymerase sigma-70 factor, ECF subfamily